MPADTFVRSGKVRDLYRVGEDRLLLVASDRLSAFDVVLPTPIPDKGRVLTGLSRFWFDQTRGIVANHLLSTDPADVPDGTVGDPAVRDDLRGRMMLGRRAEVLPVECVVRGYLSGSGWKEYQATAEVCGLRLPPGLHESERLSAPAFTPAWKAPQGQHDENIPFERVVELVGEADAERLRDLSLALYDHGAAACERAGIILADTKFEFGRLPVGRADPDRRGPDPGLVALLGRRRRTSPAVPRRATTSSSSATGSSASRGPRRRRAPSSRTTWWRAPAAATSRPSSGSPGRASPATCRRTSSPDERAAPHLAVRRQRHAQARASWTRRARPWNAACRTSGSPACPASGSGATSSCR